MRASLAVFVGLAFAACKSDPPIDPIDAGVIATHSFTAGGSGDDTVAEAKAIAGELIIVGAFHDSARFGDVTLTSAGDSDGYLVRYRSDGTSAWARSIGGEGRDDVRAVAVAADGSVWVTGVFEGTAHFGPEISLTADGPASGFVAAWSGTGALLWARRFGGPGFDDPKAIAVGADRGVLIGGAFTDRLTFGPGESGEASIVGRGTVETGFLAKLGAGGDLVWARAIGGASAARFEDVAIFGSGEHIGVGSFIGDCVLGRGESVTATLSTGLTEDGVLARFDAAGNFVRATQLGSADNYDAITAILPRADGYDLAGTFAGNFNLGGVALAAEDRLDAFVARLGDDDRARWARSIGGSDFDTANALGADDDDGLVLFGHVRGAAPVTFAKGGVGEKTITPPGGGDALYARFSADGALMAGALLGGAGSETAKGGAGGAEPRVVGELEGALPIPGGGTLTSAGGLDVFVLAPE